ncbi:MAG: CDP-alcohol phosphatidyltransferase family protein [Thiobacillaceae bacterium]
MNNLNLPNLFTGLRLLAAPGVVWFMLEDNWEAAFWLFLAAALTDGIDGWLARRLNQTTALGAALDTVTDKALGLGVLIVLAVLALVPVWITLAIVLRDAVVVLGALAYKGVAGHLEIQPTLLGKTYTFVEFAMLTLVLGHAAELLPGEQWLMPMFALVFATTLASGIQYVWIWSGKARRESDSVAK